MKKIHHLPDESIIDRIYVIRGFKVMIDSDLAELYGVETRRLKEQVKRNIKRFPEDFMFVINPEEFRSLRSQIATSNRGGTRYHPMAFTEQGVAMLSSVLNSDYLKSSLHYGYCGQSREISIFELMNLNIIKDVLFGVATGDALGVAVEFNDRDMLREHPVTGMAGYGRHGQPPGTWSDDSSLTFCLAEALTQGFDLKAVGQNFVRWRQEGYWTARGRVFDIGGTTARAITRLAAGMKPETAGDDDENSNGNGSLMRILPLLFYIAEKPAGERFHITEQVSSLTHRHIRSVTACFIYLELARYLSIGMKKADAYKSVRVVTAGHLASLNVPRDERRLFERLLKGNIQDLPEDKINSTGYVLDTLEASIWCLMTTESYREAVLKAVNLGEDTDTTGAVTGGLAGLLYGYKSIPEEWINMLARKDDIEDLAARVKRAGYREIKN